MSIIVQSLEVLTNDDIQQSEDDCALCHFEVINYVITLKISVKWSVEPSLRGELEKKKRSRVAGQDDAVED